MQLSKCRSTLLNISCNFQKLVQLLEIYYATQEGIHLLGTCIYSELIESMGVVPGCTLLVRNFSGK